VLFAFSWPGRAADRPPSIDSFWQPGTAIATQCFRRRTIQGIAAVLHNDKEIPHVSFMSYRWFDTIARHRRHRLHDVGELWKWR
jgi:hypothetical protein